MFLVNKRITKRDFLNLFGLKKKDCISINKMKGVRTSEVLFDHRHY